MSFSPLVGTGVGAITIIGVNFILTYRVPGKCSGSTSGYVTYSKLHQMVSKDLFLRVHHITSYWRVLVLDWIRQLLRAHAPFDVRRRLHYERTLPSGRRYRWLWAGRQYDAYFGHWYMNWPWRMFFDPDPDLPN